MYSPKNGRSPKQSVSALDHIGILQVSPSNLKIENKFIKEYQLRTQQSFSNIVQLPNNQRNVVNNIRETIGRLK